VDEFWTCKRGGFLSFIQHCSDMARSNLKKDKACSALAAHASHSAPIASEARVAAGGCDVLSDDLALILQRVGLSDNPTVLEGLPSKLQSDGGSDLQELKGLQEETMQKQVEAITR
jgi:hypothetical protein